MRRWRCRQCFFNVLPPLCLSCPIHLSIVCVFEWRYITCVTEKSLQAAQKNVGKKAEEEKLPRVTEKRINPPAHCALDM
jgi:hypothetical protein